MEEESGESVAKVESLAGLGLRGESEGEVGGSGEGQRGEGVGQEVLESVGHTLQRDADECGCGCVEERERRRGGSLAGQGLGEEKREGSGGGVGHGVQLGRRAGANESGALQRRSGGRRWWSNSLGRIADAGLDADMEGTEGSGVGIESQSGGGLGEALVGRPA